MRVIEREPARVAACRDAIARLRAPGVAVEVVTADVAEPAAWPMEPDLVVALHACGPASDVIVDQTLAAQARTLLLVPCCTSKDVPSAALAQQRAEQLGLPRHTEVRRRFIQSIVDAERTLRLEAAGWQTTVVNFVAPTVTPHNLLWRAERVGDVRAVGPVEAVRTRRACSTGLDLAGLEVAGEQGAEKADAQRRPTTAQTMLSKRVGQWQAGQ